MTLTFCIEYVGLNKEGFRAETWFNGWPSPDNPAFQEVMDDTRRYNSDLFPYGYDEAGIRQWFHFYGFMPVAGLIVADPKLDYQIKAVRELSDNETYIYPVLLHGGGMLNYASFHQHGLFIHPRVLKDCREGRAKILIHELNEGHGFNTHILKDFLINQASKLNVPLSAIGFLDSNYKTPELQASYGTKGFCMFHWEGHSPWLDDEQEKQRVLDIRRKKKAPYHFIALNRRVRQHRVPLVLNIMNRWEDKTIYSCDTFLTNPEEAFKDPNSSPYGQYIRSGLLTPEINAKLPKILDYTFDVNDTWVRTSLQEQAYLCLTTETMFFEKTAQFFSEKVFKPIIFLQPFLIFGPYHSLAMLHEMGYLTFDPFLNEAYDNIEDPHQRFEALLQEIDRLSKFSHEQMQTLVRRCLPIMQKNLATFKTRRMTHVKEQKLLQELTEWLSNT